MDFMNLAVNWLRRVHKLSPEMHAQCLMSKANTEDGNALVETGNCLHRNACLQWRFRPRGEDETRWIQTLQLLHRQYIIPIDHTFTAGLQQIMVKNVRKRIVVVNERPH